MTLCNMKKNQNCPCTIRYRIIILSVKSRYQNYPCRDQFDSLILYSTNILIIYISFKFKLFFYPNKNRLVQINIRLLYLSPPLPHFCFTFFLIVFLFFHFLTLSFSFQFNLNQWQTPSTRPLNHYSTIALPPFSLLFLSP